jgi:hypothetical protein
VNASNPVRSWNSVKRHVKGWNAAQFTALLKDLYDSSTENRAFLDARVQLHSGGGAALETYRQRVIEPFFPKRGFGKLKLADARKAIRDYRKATGNMAGTAELLMTYVENGAQFTHEYGDIDERFYNSIESVLGELADLLRGEGRELYPSFSERLAEVEQLTDGIGWGFHDFVADVVAQLEDDVCGSGDK